MRYATVATFLVALCLSSTAFGQADNPDATFVLHAHPVVAGACAAAGLADCGPAPNGIAPDVSVAPGELIRAFFMLNHTSDVAALDVAWDWDDSWNIDPDDTGTTYAACTTNTLSVSTPQDPGGPNTGRLVSAFDCITAGFMRIGRMHFAAGTTGCLEFVEVGDVFGTHLVDCENDRNEFDVATDGDRFGGICVGQGGDDACDQDEVPVAPTTWGRIKSSYNDR